MTPREPDRFEAKAESVLDALRDLHGPHGTVSATTEEQTEVIAAALRAAEASALERAAQIIERDVSNPHVRRVMAERIRALIPPAAAPAAPMLVATRKCGMCGASHVAATDAGCPSCWPMPDPPAPAAETGKAQGAALDTALALECAKDAHFKDQLEHEERGTKLAAAEKRIAELETALDRMRKMARDPDFRYFEDIARVADAALAARAAPPEEEGKT